MSWQGLRGHDAIVERFRLATERNRLGNAYLFVGPSGIGKRTLARRLAQTWLCRNANASFEPCGACPSCHQFHGDAHPDFQVVACPEEQAVLPLELLIGDREHRMREGLCYWMQLMPFEGRRKVAIIEDADALAPEGANALLKTLEEPPVGSILILVSHNLQRQLPTIRSRCQAIHFSPLSEADLVDVILESELVSDRESAESIAAQSDGSLDVARGLCDGAWQSFCSDFRALLAATPLDPITASSEVQTWVDQAGSENKAKRERLRQVIRVAIDLFRGMLREHVSQEQPASASGDGVEAIERRLERTILAQQELDANAHLATLIDAWIHDVADCRVALR